MHCTQLLIICRSYQNHQESLCPGKTTELLIITIRASSSGRLRRQLCRAGTTLSHPATTVFSNRACKTFSIDRGLESPPTNGQQIQGCSPTHRANSELRAIFVFAQVLAATDDDLLHAARSSSSLCISRLRLCRGPALGVNRGPTNSSTDPTISRLSSSSCKANNARPWREAGI